jgi:hypothetical protein
MAGPLHSSLACKLTSCIQRRRAHTGGELIIELRAAARIGRPTRCNRRLGDVTRRLAIETTPSVWPIGRHELSFKLDPLNGGRSLPI